MGMILKRLLTHESRREVNNLIDLLFTDLASRVIKMFIKAQLRESGYTSNNFTDVIEKAMNVIFGQVNDAFWHIFVLLNVLSRNDALTPTEIMKCVKRTNITGIFYSTCKKLGIVYVGVLNSL